MTFQFTGNIQNLPLAFPHFQNKGKKQEEGQFWNRNGELLFKAEATLWTLFEKINYFLSEEKKKKSIYRGKTPKTSDSSFPSL